MRWPRLFVVVIGVAALAAVIVAQAPNPVVVWDTTNHVAATLNVDATHDSAAKATGPQVMAECDDTSTDAVDEGDAARLRVNCTDRGLMVENSPSATAGAVSECALISAASTNATNCKAAAGRLYGWQMVNTTASLYYLRLYNTSSSPTCSSSTGFIRTIPIPASTTGAGIVVTLVYPIAYATGISFCFTGGSSSTDNTNAATGVFGAVLYK